MKNRRESGCRSHAVSRDRRSQRRGLRARPARRSDSSMRSVWSRETPGSCTRVRPLANRPASRSADLTCALGRSSRWSRAGERARPADGDRRPAVAGPDVRAHASQGLGDTLHRPPHQGRVADERRVERLARQDAGEQPHRSARVAEVERTCRRRESAHARRRASRDARARAARAARPSPTARRASRRSPRPPGIRGSRSLPCAIAPSMRRAMRNRLVAGDAQLACDLAARVRRRSFASPRSRRAGDRRRHGGEQALVLLRSAGRDAKVIRQAVVRQRAHDHAFAQQRMVDRPGARGEGPPARSCPPKAAPRCRALQGPRAAARCRHG